MGRRLLGSPLPYSRAAVWLRYLWSKYTLKFHSIELVVDGPGKACLSDSEAYIMVMNHQSALDIFANGYMTEKPFAFFSKKELLMIPLFGWAAWLAGTVYIDRKRGAGDEAALKALEKSLSAGASVLLYPEGTRSFNGELLNFKRGAFVMAIKLNRAVLPMTILDSYKLCPKKSWSMKPGRIHLWVDEPISTAGMSETDRFQLAERVREQIAKNLDREPESQENRERV